MPKFDILRVKDKSDSYTTKMERIFDLSMRLIIVGKSQLSGKSTVIFNLFLRNKYYRGNGSQSKHQTEK